MTLTRSQEKARARILHAFMEGRRGAILKAEAGTGKTFLVGKLLKELIDNGFSVCATAPTNKAVGVLEKKIPNCCAAKTTYKLLNLRVAYSQENWLETVITKNDESLDEKYDFVVIDECSMIDETILHYLFRMENSPFLLFVGDPAQLPPVQSRSNLSPVFALTDLETITMTEVVRQKADSPILSLASAVRHSTQRFLPFSVRDYAKGNGLEVVSKNDSRDLSGIPILAWRNERVRQYNRGFHALNYPDQDIPFCVGESVIFNKPYNMGEVSIYNGEECKITQVREGMHPYFRHVEVWKLTLKKEDGEHVAYTAMDERIIENKLQELHSKWVNCKSESGKEMILQEAILWRESFASISLSYAITVHKSQGSTFDTVLVDLQDLAGNRTEQYNQLLYTAITRPSESLLLLA